MEKALQDDLADEGVEEPVKRELKWDKSPPVSTPPQLGNVKKAFQTNQVTPSPVGIQTVPRLTVCVCVCHLHQLRREG